MQDQLEGNKQILSKSQCKVRDAKTGKVVESDFFQDVRFSSVDATSYQIGNKAYRYLRIKAGDPKVKIMQAKPDSNFK